MATVRRAFAAKITTRLETGDLPIHTLDGKPERMGQLLPRYRGIGLDELDDSSPSYYPSFLGSFNGLSVFS